MLQMLQTYTSYYGPKAILTVVLAVAYLHLFEGGFNQDHAIGVAIYMFFAYPIVETGLNALFDKVLGTPETTTPE